MHIYIENHKGPINKNAQLLIVKQVVYIITTWL
jgi:hypothetical protein